VGQEVNQDLRVKRDKKNVGLGVKCRQCMSE
jgi:hypothetical protein